MDSSIISFPSRGPWGDSRWRGNASGYVYKSLFEQLKPKVFIVPMVGSGTSVQVAKSLGIEAYGLDLHGGFNALTMDIMQTVGKQADLVMSHPPYSGMVPYSGPSGMWGDVAHSDDLSHCLDDADFNEKLQRVLFNQRRATVPGGHYATLIGDWRRDNMYSCYMAECVARMPASELVSIIIKTQHNCVSDSRKYARMKYPRIVHEYLVIWQKKASPVLVFMNQLVAEQAQRMAGTWRNLVQTILKALGGESTLDRIYKAVANNAPARIASNENWKAKIRQVLNQNPELFRSQERGIWALAA